MTAEEFHSALQEATNFPLRGFVLPYLKHTLPFLQRDLSNAARASNQVKSTLALLGSISLSQVDVLLYTSFAISAPVLQKVKTFNGSVYMEDDRLSNR